MSLRSGLKNARKRFTSGPWFLFLAMAVLAIGGIVYAMQATPGGAPLQSTGVKPPSSVDQGVALNDDMPQAYRNDLEKSEANEAQRAARQGNSASRSLALAQPVREREPERNTVTEAEPVKTQQAAQSTPPRTPPARNSPPQRNRQQGQADQQLAERMNASIQELGSTLKPETHDTLRFGSDQPETRPVQGDRRLSQAGRVNSGQRAPRAVGDNGPQGLIQPGEMAFATVINGVRSDLDLPVIARVDGGKLDGARLTGRFQTANNVAAYRGFIRFQTLTMPDGRSMQVNAYAVSPNDMSAAVASRVDPRIPERFLLRMAAAFTQGFTAALGETDTVTIFGESTTSESSVASDTDDALAQGVSEGVGTLEEAFRRQAENAQPIIFIDSGTQIGIVFTTLQNVPQGRDESSPINRNRRRQSQPSGHGNGGRNAATSVQPQIIDERRTLN